MVQDSDGTVRECARKSVVEIFAAVSVTDAARADLKKEMEKQGVRKNVTEEILASVIGKHEPTSVSEPVAPLRQSKMERLPSVAPPVDSLILSKDPEGPSRQLTESEQSGTGSDIQPVYVSYFGSHPVPPSSTLFHHDR
jgi:CLIP-associating protein 1/2